jgi:hypothetical protein
MGETYEYNIFHIFPAFPRPPKLVPNIWIADFEGAITFAFAGFEPAAS